MFLKARLIAQQKKIRKIHFLIVFQFIIHFYNLLSIIIQNYYLKLSFNKNQFLKINLHKVCLTLLNVAYSNILDTQKADNNIQGVFGISLRKEENETQDFNKIRQENFLVSEKLKIDFKKQIVSLLHNLKDFWQKLIDGHPNLEVYMKQILLIIDKMIQTKTTLQENLYHFQDSPNFLKLQIFYSALIENNIVEAFSYEKKLREFIEKDFQNGFNVLNTVSILNKQITALIASFLKEYGRIIMTSESTAQIFKYSNVEFLILKNIKQQNYKNQINALNYKVLT